MSEKIEIVVQASDKASGVLGGVKNTLGGLGKVALGALAVGAVAATGAVVGLGAALADCVGEAMGAQAVQEQLNAVLKSTGGVAGVTAEMANELASQLQNVTRFEDDAVLAGENMLLTFTSIGQDVFPLATQTMADMSQALGQDLTASAMQLGKALNDPIGGITALRRVGVQFTDDQTVMITKMVEVGDVAGAQGLILQELQREFGGSAEAAGTTFAGKLDILKNKLGDVKETIGAALLPVLTTLADKFIAGLNTPEFQAALDSVVKFITDTAIPKLTEFAGWFTDVGIPKVQEWIDLFREGGLQGVVDALVAWVTSPDTQMQIKEAGQSIGKTLVEGITGAEVWAEPKFTTAATDLAAWMEDPATKAIIREAGRNLGIGIVDGIKSVFTPGSAEMGGGALGILLGIRGMGYQIMTDIRMLGVEWATALVGGILSAIVGPELAAQLTPALYQFFRKITQVLTLDLEGLGRDLIASIAKGITSSDALIRAAGEAAEKAAREIRIKLGIYSPSKVFMEIGRQMMAGMAVGMNQAAQPQAAMAVMNAEAVSPGGARGPGGIVNVTLVYQPTISLADQYEVQNVLMPFIQAGVRRAQEGAL